MYSINKNIPSVKVAISAYNEEKNIVKSLNSVLMQKEEGFFIKEIWLHYDEPTDKEYKIGIVGNSLTP